MNRSIMFAALAAAIWAAPAMAADADQCPANLICANKPESIVAAMQKAGYAAKLGKDDNGDPTISSAASGYSYDIWFYGCDKQTHTNCETLQFQIVFSKDATNTPERSNKFNNAWRYGQAAIDAKGRFVVSFDVTTIGGLNEANFTDVLASWSGTLGALSNFWKDNPSPPSKR